MANSFFVMPTTVSTSHWYKVEAAGKVLWYTRVCNEYIHLYPGPGGLPSGLSGRRHQCGPTARAPQNISVRSGLNLTYMLFSWGPNLAVWLNSKNKITTEKQDKELLKKKKKKRKQTTFLLTCLLRNRFSDTKVTSCEIQGKFLSYSRLNSSASNQKSKN